MRLGLPAVAVAWSLLAGGLVAQAAPERMDVDNAAWRAERLALTGDLGLPPLPPLLADSPRSSIVFADRTPVWPDTSAYAAAGSPELVNAVIPAGPGGTGTDLPEIIQYQLPLDYDSRGPPRPLLVGYHGFGESAKSVANKSTLDEECNARGWIYLAPTGIDDQLFGSPISQQHTEVAIQWMLDTFAVDAERIYLVGFSMGGGVVANFAARRRDPNGLMVAALGLVSSTCDWSMNWHTGSAGEQAWLEHPFNFGASPAQDPFAYQRSSVLYFDPQSYGVGALPGTLLPAFSMGRNLHATPSFITWDSGDTVAQSLAQNPALVAYLQGQGATVVSHVVSGTTTGSFPFPPTPAPHSWAVLNEVQLFDWLEDKRAVRRPVVFDALIDRDATVSHVSVTQADSHAFTRVASRDGTGRKLHGVANAARIELDRSRLPVSAEVFSARLLPGERTLLSLSGFDAAPSRLVNAAGRFLPDVESNPVAGSLAVTLVAPDAPPAPGGVQAQLSGTEVAPVFDVHWTVALSSSPNPAAIGQVATLTLEAGAGPSLALLWLGVSEQLITLPSGPQISVIPATGLLALPLSPAGRVELQKPIPTDPILQGQHLHAQAVALTPGLPLAVSNAFMAWIE